MRSASQTIDFVCITQKIDTTTPYGREMYREGFCERKFRDRSLQEIAEEERRWEFATTTPSTTPIQALELVRGFAKAVQKSTPVVQR